MIKLSLTEVLFYLFFYGFFLLIIPFLLGILLWLLPLPFVIVGIDFPSGVIMDLAPVVQIPLGLGEAVFYFFVTRRAIKRYGGIRIWLFIFSFGISALLNYWIHYFFCSISMLERCDPRQYLTISGLLKIFDFYIICLASFILAVIYSNYFQKKSSKTS